MVTQKALFFLRHYNDIDHIVPVIYKWLNVGDDLADIVITSKPDYLDDYRIQFLRQLKRLHARFIDDFLPKEQQKEKKVKRQIIRLKRYHPARIAYSIRRNFFASSPIQFSSAFAERLLSDVFANVSGGVVVFDWVTLQRDLNLAHPIVEAARKRGLTTVSLPHGDASHYSRMFHLNDINYRRMATYASGTIFDYVVVPNELCARRYRPYMKAERLKVLGSSRYNDEWLKTLTTFLPRYDVRKAVGKLKVVFFLRSLDYPIFWEEVIWTIKLVTQFQEVYLVVKPHTRAGGGESKQLKQIFSELDIDSIPNLEFVSDDVHSGSLLRWADVVLDMGSSIVFEAVKCNKPVLAMEYLHANYSTVAYYMKSCVMWCRDHLYDTIHAFIDNRDHRLYDEEERNRFIQEIIAVPDANVLDRYVRFLRDCIK